MNEILVEWIAKVEGDYNTARREIAVRRKPNYDGVCFHAHQSAEKSQSYRIAKIVFCARWFV